MHRFFLLACPLALACGAHGGANSPDFSDIQLDRPRSKTPPSGPMSGQVADYLRRALAASPTIERARERVEAARAAVSASGSFPEPTVSYGFFASAVETRVGPQRHRLQVRQPLPWPGALAAETEAATLSRDAAATGSKTAGIDISYRVRQLYWKLWLSRELVTIHQRHVELLRGLSQSVRTQLEIGKATLAEASQLDLRVARLEDSIAELKAEEEALVAGLLAVCAEASGPAPTLQEPRLRPAPEEPELDGAAARDPREKAALEQARAAAKRAEAAKLAGRPRFVVGADFIEVGPRSGATDSGKDAFVVSLGLSLPIFRDRYDGRRSEALAESRMHLARARERSFERNAEVTAALAAIRDSHRQAKLHQSTLLPQAETVYQATLGQYRVTRSPFANLLLAEQELIELRVAIARIRARHELAWASLDHALSVADGGER